MCCESRTCMRKATGEPLKEYGTEREASDAADYARSKFNNNLVPYRCRTCNNWHLSPRPYIRNRSQGLG